MRDIQSPEVLPIADVSPHESTSLCIPVLLFAALKEAVGSDRIIVSVPDAEPNEKVSLQILLACCVRQFPALEPWLRYLRVAVNCEYSQNDQLVGATDEIAFLPPVSGGAFS